MCKGWVSRWWMHIGVLSKIHIQKEYKKNLILYKGLNCYCTQGRGGCWSLSQLSVGEGRVILVTSLHFTAGPKDKSLTLTPTANLGSPISTHVHCLCPVGGSGVPGQNLHSPVLGIKLLIFLLIVTWLKLLYVLTWSISYLILLIRRWLIVRRLSAHH